MQGMRKTPIIWKSRGGQTGYLIVFYGNGGTSEVFSSYTDADGKLESLPGATREGYNFLGWQTEDGTDVTTDTVFTGDAVVGAQWKTPKATITVTGSGGTYNNAYACLTMPDGTKVQSAGTYQVEIGATITCMCYGGDSAKITLNGTTVASGSRKEVTYNYAVAEGDATIKLYSFATTGSSGIAEAKITITEE